MNPSHLLGYIYTIHIGPPCSSFLYPCPPPNILGYVPEHSSSWSAEWIISNGSLMIWLNIGWLCSSSNSFRLSKLKYTMHQCSQNFGIWWLWTWRLRSASTFSAWKHFKFMFKHNWWCNVSLNTFHYTLVKCNYKLHQDVPKFYWNTLIEWWKRMIQISEFIVKH